MRRGRKCRSECFISPLCIACGAKCLELGPPPDVQQLLYHPVINAVSGLGLCVWLQPFAAVHLRGPLHSDRPAGHRSAVCPLRVAGTHQTFCRLISDGNAEVVVASQVRLLGASCKHSVLRILSRGKNEITSIR